ncbi:MAG: hypothetical protein ACXW31_14865 [Thermoanaerobaculia bacterium]
MRRALLVLLFTVAATGVSGSSLTMDTGTYGGSPPDIVWWGYAYYLNDAGEPGVGVVMDGNLSLFDYYGQYDDNSDEAIDEADPIWSFLVLWQDANRDGISQPEELQPIGTSGVTRLSTQYRWTGRHDQHGNLFRYAAQCDAQSSGPYYDVFLRNVQ